MALVRSASSSHGLARSSWHLLQEQWNYHTDLDLDVHLQGRDGRRLALDHAVYGHLECNE